MGEMSKALFDYFNSLIGVCIYSMGFSVDQSTELDDELLESKEIQLLSLSFFQKLDIKISNKVLNFIFVSQKEQFEVLEELDELDNT